MSIKELGIGGERIHCKDRQVDQTIMGYIHTNEGAVSKLLETLFQDMKERGKGIPPCEHLHHLK
jgi:hypothetical protein